MKHLKQVKRNSSIKKYCLCILILIISWSVWKGICWIKNIYDIPLSAFTLTGKLNYTTNNDIDNILISLGKLDGFISQDIDIIYQQIKKIPWINYINIRKQWPCTLDIHVVEYVPIAYWNDACLFDMHGKIFSIPKKNISLPTIHKLYGPIGSEKYVFDHYLMINKILTKFKVKFKSISMNHRQSWELILQDGVKLKQGRHDIINRLKRFVKFYPILLQQAQDNHKRISYIDLRYTMGLAVKWTPIYIHPNSN